MANLGTNIRIRAKNGGEEIMKHSEKWYQRRLARYFTEHYEHYEDDAEYFNDPAPNQWLFDIPEFDVRIELTCDDSGVVSEQRYTIRGDAR